VTRRSALGEALVDGARTTIVHQRRSPTDAAGHMLRMVVSPGTRGARTLAPKLALYWRSGSLQAFRVIVTWIVYVRAYGECD
jgi:hypothetical protein